MLNRILCRCFLSFFFITIFLNAQTLALFESPVMVNEIQGSNVDTDGAKTIAVYNENVYAVWIDWDNNNICFAKSDDRGQTFSDPVYPSSIIDTAIAQLFPSITVDKYGTVFIIWTVIEEDFTVNSGIFMTRSSDGGASFEEARQVVTMPSVYCSIATYEDNVYLFYPSSDNYPFGDYYFQRSLNNGDSFEDTVRVTDAECQDSLKFDSMTDMLVDKDGVIHLAWNDARRVEGNSDIYYCQSSDNGQSFSANIPVNDLSNATANKLHWDPSIGIMQNGDVHIAWRYHEQFQNNDNWDYTNFIAVKYHDSDVFTNQRVFNPGYVHCSTPSIAINEHDQMYIVFSARDSKLFCYSLYPGDEDFTQHEIGKDYSSHGATSYPSVVIDDETKACILWTDNTDIYFTRGGYENPNTIEGEVKQADSFDLIQNYPNPFNPVTTISYHIPKTVNVVLQICDINGQLVEKLVNQSQNAGSYRVQWNASDYSSGVYFYQVQAGDFQQVKKMLLIK